MERMTMGFFSDSVRNPVNPVHPVQYSFPGLAGEHEGCLPSFPCPKRQVLDKPSGGGGRRWAPPRRLSLSPACPPSCPP